MSQALLYNEEQFRKKEKFSIAINLCLLKFPMAIVAMETTANSNCSKHYYFSMSSTQNKTVWRSGPERDGVDKKLMSQAKFLSHYF